MTITLPQIDRNILTNSRMSCARQCLRKHWFRYEIGLVPEREADPLRIGSAVHIGLESLAAGRTADGAVADATARYGETPPWCKTDEHFDDWAVECETVAALVAGYAWRWFGVSATETIVCNEQTFDLPIVNPDTGAPSTFWRTMGKIDKIVRTADGRLLIREHKTTGDSIDPDSDYWRRLTIDQQISHYTLAAQMLGHDVEGIDYDVIRKPGIKPRKLTKAEQQQYLNTAVWFNAVIPHGGTAPERETPRMYGARLLFDIGERPDFYYARREIPRLDADMAEYKQELWDQAADLRERRRTGRWYRNSQQCVGFGRCEYLDVCSTGADPYGPPMGFKITANIHPELHEEPTDAAR